jgi:hypothetical protein
MIHEFSYNGASISREEAKQALQEILKIAPAPSQKNSTSRLRAFA